MRHELPCGRAALILAACALVACQSSTNRAVVADAPRALPPKVAAAAPTPRGAPGAVTEKPSAGTPNGAAPGQVAASVPAAVTPVDGTPAETVPDATVSWPRTVDGANDTTVARVGGRDILLTELVSKWIMRDPNGVRAILDDLLISRLVVLEAASYGIELPAGTVEQEIGSRLRDLETSAQKVGAPSLEVYIQKTLGLNQQTFLRELEREVAVDLLATRCIRTWLFATDRREFRVIAVKDKAASDQVQARLARGEAFADVAKDLSTDQSAKDGGRMPPLVRSDQGLARMAFAAQVGEVSGPIQNDSGFVFMLVEAAPQGESAPWSEIGASVEASLQARGIEDPEYWQWKEAMFQRYDIDVTPFLELAGR